LATHACNITSYADKIYLW